MPPSSRFGWPSLTAIFLLLSLLNIATASPLPDDHVNKTLVARTQTIITLERYEAYLKKYFPATDHYLFYSGKSEDQVKVFMAKNPSYYYYDNLINAFEENHPWYKAFDVKTEMDDAEAASKALALTARGQVLVFGAIEYKKEGTNSFFTQQEIDKLHEGIQTGRIMSINHMAKGATSPSQVMAKEDAKGVFTWQKGHKEGDKNASGAQCKRGIGGCDTPKVKPKTKSGSTEKAALTTAKKAAKFIKHIFKRRSLLRVI